MLKIIGIDPGYAIVGWGVINYDSMRFVTMSYGAITTPSNIDFLSRISMIYEQLDDILNTYKPDEMAIEKLFFASNKKTGIDVAQARGVILLSAKCHGLSVSEYTPIQVKQGVVGYGRAEKRQVMNMTKRLLNLNKMPKLDDTADALAIAIAHAHSYSSRLLKLKETK